MFHHNSILPRDFPSHLRSRFNKVQFDWIKAHFPSFLDSVNLHVAREYRLSQETYNRVTTLFISAYTTKNEIDKASNKIKKSAASSTQTSEETEQDPPPTRDGTSRDEAASPVPSHRASTEKSPQGNASDPDASGGEQSTQAPKDPSPSRANDHRDAAASPVPSHLSANEKSPTGNASVPKANGGEETIYMSLTVTQYVLASFFCKRTQKDDLLTS